MNANVHHHLAAFAPPVDLLRRVRVEAPGRLHLGFLDPDGSLGRRFGSLGLVVDELSTEVELSAAPRDRFIANDTATQAEVERVSHFLDVLRERTGLDVPLQLRLIRVLPAHCGLGSGTQLALAVGRAFVQWHGLQVDTPTIAHWLGRGQRSGIGIAGFDLGGLVLDGGPGRDGPAPLLSRIDLPADWAVIVLQDPRTSGLSGAAERAAIAALTPLPQADAADICHQVLMRILPGAIDADFEAFALGVNRVQQVLGAHFSSQQGGAFSSTAVERAVTWMAESARSERELPAGAPGAAIGQSSWGPTGFAIVASRAQAEALVDAARAVGVVDPALAVRIVGARNRGATVSDHSAAPAPV